MTSCFVFSISSGFPASDLLGSWAVPAAEEGGSRREASGEECVVVVVVEAAAAAAPDSVVALGATDSTTLSDGAGAVMLGKRKKGEGEEEGERRPGPISIRI